MPCSETHQLTDLLAGTLSDSRAEAMERHITNCANCRQKIETLTAESRRKWDRWNQLILVRDLPNAVIPGGAFADEDVPRPAHGSRDTEPIQDAAHPTMEPDEPARDMLARDGVASDEDLPEIAGYEILRELGRGGMGVVYLAKHIELNRAVAVKMLLHGALSGPDRLTRFRSEATAIARLNHPNIIHIHDVGEVRGVPFLVLEYIDGPDLAEVVRGKPQPARPSAAIVATLAQAVAEAHRAGVMHRDVKLANILLDLSQLSGPRDKVDLSHDEWRRIQPKLTDFGLAKAEGSDAHTRTGEMLGTPQYLAPEMLESKVPWSRSADIYALGVVLYELLAGQPPFVGETVMEVLWQVKNREPPAIATGEQTIPRDLDTICRKCLQKDPSRRYPDAESLAEDLVRFETGRPIMARPTPIWEQAWKWARRRPALAGASVACLGAVATLLVMWAQFTRDLSLANEATQREAVRARQQADIAAKNRDESEQHLAQAQQAARHYLNQVYTDQRLAAADLVSLRMSLLEEACQVYESILRSNTDPETVWEFSRVHYEMGRLYGKMNEPEEALPHFQTQVKRLQGVIAQHPDHPRVTEMLQNLASGWQSIGLVSKRLGDDSLAMESYHRGQRVFEQLAASDPLNAGHRWGLTGCYQRLGVAQYDLGEYDKAEQTLRQAVVTGNQLPHVPDYLLAAAHSHMSFARVLERSGQSEAAEQHLRTAASVGHKLVQTRPLPRYKTMFASCLRQLAAMLSKRGDREQARQQMMIAIRIRERLSANAPTDLDYRAKLVSAYRQLAGYWRDDDPSVADPWQLKADAVHNEGYLADAADQALQTAEHLIRQAGIALDNFVMDEAERHYLSGLEILAAPDNKLPVDYETRRLTTLAQAGLARVRTWSGRHEEAVALWDRAAESAPLGLPVYLQVYRAVSLAHAGEGSVAVQLAEQICAESLWPKDAGTAAGHDDRDWVSHLELGTHDLTRLARVFVVAARADRVAAKNVPSAVAQRWARRGFELLAIVDRPGTIKRRSSMAGQAVFYSQVALLRDLVRPEVAAKDPDGAARRSLELWREYFGGAPPSAARLRQLKYSPELSALRELEEFHEFIAGFGPPGDNGALNDSMGRDGFGPPHLAIDN